jgi:predicted small lipoprotein YifL
MFRLHSLIAIAALALLAGCTSLGNLTTPSGNVLVQVAVDVAVGQVVGTGPTAKAKAAQISAIAQQALSIDQGSSVTLAALEGAVNAQIAKLNLPPADALAAQVLVQTVESIITQKLTGGATTTPAGTVTPTSSVAIALVLQDVITACSVY